MKITVAIDDAVVRRARQRAEAMGTTVNQLIREYLEDVAGLSDPKATAAEFVALSRESSGSSRGWKFNREQLHER